MEEFIEKFKDQLIETEVNITPASKYRNEEYWDSLTAMVIKVMIEDDYKVSMEPEEFANYETVQDLYEYIQSQQ